MEIEIDLYKRLYKMRDTWETVEDVIKWLVEKYEGVR